MTGISLFSTPAGYANDGADASRPAIGPAYYHPRGRYMFFLKTLKKFRQLVTGNRHDHFMILAARPDLKRGRWFQSDL
jgi:hypothetical protein